MPVMHHSVATCVDDVRAERRAIFTAFWETRR